MVSSRYGARLSQTDVVDLATASEQLAEVATTLQRANPSYAAACVRLLMAANDVVVRLQNKGAAAYARYMERHGLQMSSNAPAAADPVDQVAGERSTPQNDEEE